MIGENAFSIANTLLPLAALAGLAVVLPWALLPRATLSHRTLLMVLGLSALILALASAVIILGSSLAAGGDPVASFRVAPRVVACNLGRTVALSAFLWGPILLLVGYFQAMGVEKRRGEAAARR